MNTAGKILPAADIAALAPARPLLLATGYFEILLVDLVRELHEARRRSSARTLVAAVLLGANQLVPQAARARMAAALRVVDYVFISENEHLDGLAAALQPAEIVRLEEAETRRTRELIQYVRRRQSC